VTQTLPLQQPEQLVASHAQPTPATQCCPLPHDAPPAQVQAPALQPSFLVMSHAAQLPPPVPQAVEVVPPRQLVPEQQPLAQDAGLHTHAPLTHAWPDAQAALAPQVQEPLVQVSVVAGQVAHAAPPVPHTAAACDASAMHCPAEQHPDGQLVPSQTQLPA